MRKIAVVGSGVNGLLAAHGLLRQGHQVTLYSERSAQDWLDKVPPTGTACRFSSSLELETELGLNHWDGEAPAIEGVHLTFCHKPGWQLIDLMGRLHRPARAVDVRLQSHRWFGIFLVVRPRFCGGFKRRVVAKLCKNNRFAPFCMKGLEFAKNRLPSTA